MPARKLREFFKRQYSRPEMRFYEAACGMNTRFRYRNNPDNLKSHVLNFCARVSHENLRDGIILRGYFGLGISQPLRMSTLAGLVGTTCANGSLVIKKWLARFETEERTRRAREKLERKIQQVSMRKKAATEDQKWLMAAVLRLRSPIEALGIQSARTRNIFKARGIKTIADLVCYDQQQLLNLKNFGRKSLEEVKEALRAMDLKLGMDLERYLPRWKPSSPPPPWV